PGDGRLCPANLPTLGIFRRLHVQRQQVDFRNHRPVLDCFAGHAQFHQEDRGKLERVYVPSRHRSKTKFLWTAWNLVDGWPRPNAPVRLGPFTWTVMLYGTV